MQQHLRLPACLALLFMCASVSAMDRYVSLNGGHAQPFTSWLTAATNIQDAIEVSSDGDVIWVTNGVYASGGKVIAGDLTNRVALDKQVTVQSVNGPALTVIQGIGGNGPGAVRCAWLTDGALLSGFTLRGGATRSAGEYITLQHGGGVWCVSTNAVVDKCVITGNSASTYGGGGAYSGTINNCTLTGNSADKGGACYGSVLNNCTLTANSAQYGGGSYGSLLNNCTLTANRAMPTAALYPPKGGGSYSGTLNNCIVWGNYGSEYSGSTMRYTCSSPLAAGEGNIAIDPQLLDGTHIAVTSPCRGAGSTNYVTGMDIDGEPWTSSPSMGCDEVWEAALTGPLSVSAQAARPQLVINCTLEFTGWVSGRVSRLEWSFGDGLVVTDFGSQATHMWTNTGDYTVTLTAFNQDHPAGVSTNLLIRVVETASEVIAWGDNAYGETSVPCSANNALVIAARGAEHSLALRADGTVAAWGRNDYRQCDVPPGATNVVAIAAVGYHSLALHGNGRLMAWGDNTYSQINVPASATNLVAIAGGGWHSLALRADGTVVAWGQNNFGQRNVPASATNVIAIAGGIYHNLVLRADGILVAWGSNSDGQRNVPASATNVAAIATGNYYNLVLRKDGTVVAWGQNNYGQCNVPPDATNVVAIAGGSYHAVALRADGKVVTWGRNDYQQCNVPPNVTNVLTIAGGRLYGLALVSVSAVWHDRPQITSNPFNQSAVVGDSALFLCTAAGTQPLNYQWKFNGTDIVGGNRPYLLQSGIQITQAGDYVCVVTNAMGDSSSSVATLTVTRQPTRFDTTPANLGMTDGGFQMRVTGLAGQGPSVIYASTNLVDWEGIVTNPPYVGTLDFLDSTATNLPLRFYKAVEGP